MAEYTYPSNLQNNRSPRANYSYSTPSSLKSSVFFNSTPTNAQSTTRGTSHDFHSVNQATRSTNPSNQQSNHSSTPYLSLAKKTVITASELLNGMENDLTITKDFVKKRNVVNQNRDELLELVLQENEKLKAQVSQLNSEFLTYKQSRDQDQRMMVQLAEEKYLLTEGELHRVLAENQTTIKQLQSLQQKLHNSKRSKLKLVGTFKECRQAMLQQNHTIEVLHDQLRQAAEVAQLLHNNHIFLETRYHKQVGPVDNENKQLKTQLQQLTEKYNKMEQEYILLQSEHQQLKTKSSRPNSSGLNSNPNPSGSGLPGKTTLQFSTSLNELEKMSTKNTYSSEFQPTSTSSSSMAAARSKLSSHLSTVSNSHNNTHNSTHSSASLKGISHHDVNASFDNLLHTKDMHLSSSGAVAVNGNDSEMSNVDHRFDSLEISSTRSSFTAPLSATNKSAPLKIELSMSDILKSSNSLPPSPTKTVPVMTFSSTSTIDSSNNKSVNNSPQRQPQPSSSSQSVMSSLDNFSLPKSGYVETVPNETSNFSFPEVQQYHESHEVNKPIEASISQPIIEESKPSLISMSMPTTSPDMELYTIAPSPVPVQSTSTTANTATTKDDSHLSAKERAKNRLLSRMSQKSGATSATPDLSETPIISTPIPIPITDSTTNSNPIQSNTTGNTSEIQQPKPENEFVDTIPSHSSEERHDMLRQIIEKSMTNHHRHHTDFVLPSTEEVANASVATEYVERKRRNSVGGKSPHIESTTTLAADSSTLEYSHVLQSNLIPDYQQSDETPHLTTVDSAAEVATELGVVDDGKGKLQISEYDLLNFSLNDITNFF